MNYDALTVLLIQADKNNNTGNYDEAEILTKNVLTALKHAGDSGENQLLTKQNTLHCTALITLADTYSRRGDYREALTLARTSLGIAEEYKLAQSKAKALNLLGNAYQYLADYGLALESYTRALAVFEELGDTSRIATVTANLGVVSAILSDYDKAFEFNGKALAMHEELGDKSSAAMVKLNLGNLYRIIGSYDKALEYYEQSLGTHKELGDKSFMAKVTGNIGIIHAQLGSFDKALEYFEQAIDIHMELGAKSQVATVTGYIGNVYQLLAAYDKALEYYSKALAIHEELGAKSSVAIETGNLGYVYRNLGAFDKALEYFSKAIAVHVELGEISQAAIFTGSIGNVYQQLGSFDRALEYYSKALAVHEELGNKSSTANVKGNIGELYADTKNENYDAVKAEEFLMQALEISTALGEKQQLIAWNKSLADLYEHEGRIADAFHHYKKYIGIKEELQIDEVKNQAEQREREKEIAIAKATADAKHQATEQLLHNVLPPSIADKMLGGTKLIAEKLPSVSVLFADIVNFTKLSQRITPEELVEGLDRIFSKFDALAEKYGLEKIKTIGDAYMVVAGAPVPRHDHAQAMALFAIEIMNAMKEFRSFSTGEEIQLRIGIHSGEVVAGVIGKKKFAYDLWGDAVNTASRMESHGEAGKIHVSEEFKHAVETQNFASLQFIERGEMHIKGKGMMKTYFLEKV
jgi:adenylate cyclase